MKHYVERSLAFGQKKSSNYAQRWAYAVITLMWSRFDAEERVLFDAETDPARRAMLERSWRGRVELARAGTAGEVSALGRRVFGLDAG